ncbi:methyl-accepting chemotaxis protein [Rhodoferax sp.]|uniref:methyl-accepting chemotaxis protein n=1 Tax=Rhodoferax sp. TaxID=50421 RepID=UPI0025D0EAC9|nr:methyl-accepting chemotaxis protein [Rhodoferax sp.]
MKQNLRVLELPEPVSKPAPIGLFGAHGIWALGVHIMRSINFASKALIVSLLFSLPIAWLSWSYFSAQNAAIAFSLKERDGVRYLQAASPVLQLALQLRASPADASGAVTEALDKSYAGLEKIQQEMGANLGTVAAYAELQQARSAAKSQGGDAVERFVRNTAHIQALIAVMTTATDGSNLTLDPDIDSYYVMDAAAFRLPDLMERTGLMRAAGAAALRDGQLSLQFRAAIDKADAIAEFHQANMLAGIAKSVQQTPELSSRIQIDASRDATQKFLDAVEKTIISAATLDSSALASFAAQGDAAFTAQAALLDRLLPVLDTLLDKRVKSAQQQVHLTIVILVVTLLLAAYAFYAFFLVTRGGLRLISQHLQEMAEGDLRRAPSQPWGRDEPALVIVDLRKAYDSLHLLIRKVRHSARDLAGTSAEIARASLDLSSRTESAASSLEQQAATMEQIGASAKQMAEHSEAAASLARENAGVAEQGGVVIRDVVQVMGAINQSSRKIGDIISTIDGIAFQTNILALNAAVEAARAGEQGRGFAVVATEVRVLAQRSAAAAKEIKDLITTSVHNVENGSRVVDSAGATMEEILGNAQRIQTLLREIAVGSREQAEGVGQSVAAIQLLEQNTQQNAALVEQTSAAAGALSDQSEGLRGEIANFKVA